MTCHVVMIGEYSDKVVDAIFSTKEKADEYILANTKPHLGDIPYYAGEVELDPEVKTSYPKLYITNFHCKIDGIKREIYNLYENIPTTAYERREFEYSESSHYGYGHIVLENKCDHDKLIKIISDRVYEKIFQDLSNLIDTE